MTKKQESNTLTKVIDKLNKLYGDGSVIRLGDQGSAKVKTISTGSVSLDYKLGIGGYPCGRIIEIYGPEMSGKSTLTLHAIAEAQKQGGKAAYIDAEHAFDKEYAEKIGVDVDDLIISQPSNGEQALEIVDHLIQSGDILIVIIDSVAALVPKAELEGEMGDTKMGLQARLMSQGMRKLSGNINKTNTVCIFINQLRDKIGAMFGSPETTTGGNALKFYSSVRLDIRHTGQIKDDGEVIGGKRRVKIAKNKLAPPFKQAEFDIIYGKGIDHSGELIDLGIQYNIIKQSGSWFSYGETKLGQGRETVRHLLDDNKELANEIEGKIIKHIRES